MNIYDTICEYHKLKKIINQQFLCFWGTNITQLVGDTTDEVGRPT